MEPGLKEKAELGLVGLSKKILNLILKFWEAVLFPQKETSPKKILIFKVGNIGDIICAIPSFIAIRKNFPGAEITLLTSPGDGNVPGASELLSGARYLDRIIKYSVNDLDSFGGILRLVRGLRKERYDLFINLPADSWASFRVLFRNMVFARLLGARKAIGFRVRVLINLFKRTQIDYASGRQETDTLLDILTEGGVNVGEVNFDLPISRETEEKTRRILDDKWGKKRPKFIVAVQFGTKNNFPEKRWFPERFSAVLEYLIEKYDVHVVIMGGPADVREANLIARGLKSENVLITAGTLSVMESVALLKHCSFLLGIDSGLMHAMAAFKKPTVALFSAMNVPGLWFPYGPGHEVIYHRRPDLDCRGREYIRRSMELITVDEVKAACDLLIRRL